MGESPAKSEPRRTLATAPAARVSPSECLRALNHRIRRDILRRLHDLGEARSPKELAKELRTRLNSISYHVKVLEQRSLIALTDTRRVRGGEEHFYASTVAAEPSVNHWLALTAKGDAEP